MPQALQEAGYATTIVGKWHLGHADRKYWPRQRGFDHQYGPLLGEIDYFTHSAHGVTTGSATTSSSRRRATSHGCSGDEAVRVIQQQDPERPFFLYLAFNAPHTPYQVPKETMSPVRLIKDRPRAPVVRRMITAMDAEIGKVVRALDAKSCATTPSSSSRATTAGPLGQVHRRGRHVKEHHPADNSPFRDGKGTLYEGGRGSLQLVNWPGQFRPGSIVNGPVHIVDMYPTLAGLARAPLGKHKPLDGLDMWPTWSQGKPSPRTEVVYNIEPFRAGLRKGAWKLIWQTTLPSKVELFDIAHDSAETTNVAEKHPQVVTELQQRIEALSREAVPPLIFGEAMPALKASSSAALSSPRT